MARSIAVSAALLLLLAPTARAQNTGGQPTTKSPDPKKEAQFYYHEAQAALYSALAHAEALANLAEEAGDDLPTDIALNYVKTINRDANGANTSTVKMGQAQTKVEKEDQLKTTRSELDAALKSTEQAHAAVDGHGKLGPPAKEIREHLRKAADALRKLADPLDTKSLKAPGSSSSD